MSNIVQFPGLFSAVDPHDIPPGGATVQDNWQSDSGSLHPRRGLKRLTYDYSPGTIAQITAMGTWTRPEKTYALLLSSSSVYLAGAAGNPIEFDVSNIRPSCWAQTRDGKLVRINGIERGSVWDGNRAYPLGITAPTTAAAVATPGGGNATAGDYQCAYRYKDLHGQFSNLSPLATVTAANNDSFSWSGIVASSEERCQGSKAKVQLFRSLSDDAKVVYLVAEIAWDAATYAADTMSDNDLADQDPLPITNPDGSLSANRFDPPPAGMSVCVIFQDRAFYAVQPRISLSEYSTDAVNFGTSIVGLFVHREGYQPEKVTAVTSVGGALNLTLETSGNVPLTTLLAQGAYVGGDPAERNLILYSEVDLPEAVPPGQNTIVVQENVDDHDFITALAHHGAVLWVFKERHTYRLSFVRQPVIDAGLTLAYSRGCLNQRCWKYFEDVLYTIDHYGAWRLGPEGYQAISDPVIDYWREGTIDFSKSDWFFVSVEPNRQLVRYHVCFAGDEEKYPKRALVYHIRDNIWWTESYPLGLAGTALFPWGGRMRCIVGGDQGHTLVMDEGYCDFIVTPVRGTVTSATSTTLTDSSASFASAGIIYLTPVVITGGTGQGQVRTIRYANSNTTLTVTKAWDTIPDATSTYLVGGIKAEYKTGLYTIPFADEDQDDPGDRALSVTYQPTDNAVAQTLHAKLFLDHEVDPEEMKTPGKDGPVAWDANSAYLAVHLQRTFSVQVDAPGFGRLPFRLRNERRTLHHRFVAAGLETYQGEEAIKVYALDLEQM